MNQHKKITVLVVIISLFFLAGCQSNDEIQNLPGVDPEQTRVNPTTELNPTLNLVEEANNKTEIKRTPTSETIQTRNPDDIEEAQEISGDLSDPEAEQSCGQILPLASINGTPGVVGLPAVQLDETTIPQEAWPAVERMLEAPETVGLAAFEIGRESEGFFMNPDVPMPLASVVKVINLIAYARAVEDGLLDPSSWIDLDELNTAYLPRVDLGAHRDALNEMEERTLIAGDPPAVPLEELPGMMIKHSSNAAADFIHLAVGQRRLEQTIIDLGLDSHTAICPWIGQFLILANHERVGSHRTAIEGYLADPSLYAADVMAFANRFVEDEEFRNKEIAWRRRQPTFDVWRLFAENLNTKASAMDYARLLSQIFQSQVGSPYINFLVRRSLEWPANIPSNQDSFSVIGYKGGSLPGILTTAYYAQRQSDGRQVVVVLFFRDLPRNSYQAWLRDNSHDKLARWLLSEEGAIDYLNEVMELR